MRIQFRADRALFGNFCHRFAAGAVKHGPQSWPWWRLFSIVPYRANPGISFEQAPVHHWVLWLYTRRGAWSWHVGMDCRTPEQRGFA